MILLRLACLSAGMAVLVVPPALLFPKGVGFHSMDSAAALPAPLLLAALSFFFIALKVHHGRLSPALTQQCVQLLLAPLLAGVLALWISTQPLAMWMSAGLIGFTMVVLVALIAPLLQEPSAGRLRARRRPQLASLR
ncbi:hypothetical protein [Massilia sp. MS-15]|uniref:hypothetical protein n=1 Tax=Massilia sp. MS-15 TaxID=2878200 RepID=UPI001CD75902|nr:hypothetical protein [Massilia sp. MS-15]MCA1246803.1 hypothetical protein [Massilia sp. MS-15]